MRIDVSGVLELHGSPADTKVLLLARELDLPARRRGT
jgi:hypothetical protein